MKEKKNSVFDIMRENGLFEWLVLGTKHNPNESDFLQSCRPINGYKPIIYMWGGYLHMN